MTDFSERKGLKKARAEIQLDSMDEALRNRLWNVLDFYYWSKGTFGFIMGGTAEPMRSFLMKLWHYYFKKPVDNIYPLWFNNHETLRKYYFRCSWNEVYDFIEFAANNYPDIAANESFMKTCNDVLESELSAYRFVGGKIAQITAKTEISEIEEALESPFKNVNMHLDKALELWSDRKSPDYRNSIKESISAVEAVCRLIVKNKNATLGRALDIIKKEGKIELHPALKKAFDSLYGYTSGAEGIRHAFSDENVSISVEDAKLMLVSCSAFVNYLTTKASRARLMME